MGPALYSLEADVTVMKRLTHVVDVGVGDDIKYDRQELGLRHGFASSREFIDRDGMPDHLALMQERVVGKAVEVLDEGKKIVDNGRGSDGTFVIAVVVEEAIKEEMLKRLAFDAVVAAQGNGFLREVSCISGEKR